MQTNGNALRALTQGGLIAAMYTVLTVAIAPAAFGGVQLRVSELLTVLPVFTPAAIPGLSVGCALSNLLGLAMGVNTAGAWDVLIGPLATLAAAVLTYRWRHIRFKGLPVLATLPPVLFNALIIGAELTVVLGSGWDWPLFALFAAQIALGQLGACTVGGLLLYTALERTGAANRIFK